MGACSSNDIQMDQPAPDIEEIQKETCPIKLFELGFPFTRTHILAFEERLNEATTADGVNVSMDKLKESYQTEAWNDL